IRVSFQRHGDDYVRRRDDNERKHRGGESVERRRRDPEKESRRDRDKHREREGTRERRDEDRKDRYAERSKEASRDRRGDKERDRRDERDRDTEKRKERDTLVDGKRHSYDYRENSYSRRNREEKHDREREKERHRDKERDRAKDRERHNEEDRDKRREERDKERRREEQHREHKIERERKRHEESGEGGRDQIEKYDREQRDRHRERERHKDDYEEKRNDKDRRERHGDRKHSERKEERGNDTAVCSYSSPFLQIKDDYEEDFEELDQSENEGDDEKEPEFPQVGEEREEPMTQKRKEIEAIQRAMNEENERVGTTQSRQSMSRGEEDTPKRSRASSRGRFIDFVAAKQREVSKKVATKQKKRSTELLRLIDLDFSMTFSLLDLPPVNEYDMYIRTFGTANTKQAYVQCNEDNADRDIQTDEIEVCEKWTQHPPEHNGACGGEETPRQSSDALRVMVVLLEEVQAERKSRQKLRTQTDTLSFSDGSLQLNTKLPFLYGRHISLVHFSQVQRHTMMSVHTPTTKPSAVRLDSFTIICIWNIWEPSRPQKILVYESEVQCCCFSPGKAILVFAGTSVGSVLLWDLREHAGNHYRLKIGEDEWTFRQPTFSTGIIYNTIDVYLAYHFINVTYVLATLSWLYVSLSVTLFHNPESSGLSFQLASLDESGVLNFWVGWPTKWMLHIFLYTKDFQTGRRVLRVDAVKTGPLQTLHLKFLPTDSNHFFIGTNMGLVSHGTSHGLKAPPKFYRFQGAGVRPVDVSSIHFSPFRQNLFLVGCTDGSIRLHAVSHEQPVAEWKNSTAGEAVVSLQWTQTRPTVFCVLDAVSNLHIWDLMKNDTEPVVTERMSADRVTAMAVFGDSGQQNTYSGIALVHESGKIEMHYFTRNFTVPVPAEEEKLESMMTEGF
uniref:WD repeat domain 60 n=1 Tax=Seriola lalandi dorsalis TaxID=1841481 RepID=A0A3B4YE20_SERLL